MVKRRYLHKQILERNQKSFECLKLIYKNDFIKINICLERKDFVKSPVKIFNKKERLIDEELR